MNTYGRSDGLRGNFSTNYQLSGRELMTPDEVRLLDNRYAILFIRGERPVLDEKYDIMKHPNIKKGADGGAEPYLHGESLEEGVHIEVVDASKYTEDEISKMPIIKLENIIPMLDAFDDVSIEDYFDYLKKEQDANEKNKQQKQNPDA